MQANNPAPGSLRTPKIDHARRWIAGLGAERRRGLFCLTLLMAGAMTAQQPASLESAMRQHYDAAERLLATSDTHQADFEFRLFLADALAQIAGDRSHIGQYTRAVPLFEHAIELAPNNLELRLNFAEEALAAHDFPRSRDLTQAALSTCPTTSTQLSCARLYFLLGQAQLNMGDFAGARDALETAVSIEPTYEHGYFLAKAYFGLQDLSAVARIFGEMKASYGDSAALHMDFGRAYGEADFPEQAIIEFNRVLATDPNFPEAHYSLGAAYLKRSGDTGFALAEAEFHRELAHNPNDFYSWSQLGYIAMSRHDLLEAEKCLSRAATLDPRNPDNFLLLGEVYTGLNRPTEAEAALRQAIAVTSDPSRNHFQIRGAHYQLGRLLLQRGDTAGGKQEMKIVEDLLLQNRLLDQANLTGKPVTGYAFPVAAPTAPPDAKAVAAEQAFEQQIAPALADAYNNLGSFAAADKDFPAAVAFFEQAAAWNPKTEGLDFNWGRAAFALKQYRQAALCLGRYLESHPDAQAVREPLGMSRFLLGDFPGTLQALTPMQSTLDATPLLAYAYAESLMQTGEYERGLERLQSLTRVNPDLPVLHLALGKAYASHSRYPEAETEFRTTLRLRPDDSEALHQLEHLESFTRKQ
jgi:tetratricopeptide (TPR) repeat protein